MKKFLSLVLALVMTMSLVTISAGAKDYEDSSDVNYNEAVDVVSALKIVEGYPDGSFQPAKTLTRAEAAKIICNMILGPTTAAALSADTAPFSDVPTTHWAAGYIAYCAQQSIINGYGNGAFGPSDTLTGYQFMKMLLTALGYDADIEGYVGGNWSIPVAKQALYSGLDKGNDDFDGNVAVTREAACLYSFNALKADMVEYGQRTTINVGGAEVVVGAGEAHKVGWSDSKDYRESVRDGDKHDGYLQFCEKYFSNLKLKDLSGVTDAFGRPSNTWYKKNDKVGTYPKAADLTYKKSVKGKDIFADLGLDKADAYTYDVVIDGYEYENALPVKKGTAGDVKLSSVPGKTGYVGDGSKVEVFEDEQVITVINTYVMKVDGEYDEKDEVLNLEAAKNDLCTPADRIGSAALSSDDFAGLDEFKDEDIVTVTVAYNGKDYDVQSIALAKKVPGTVAEYVDEESVTLDETYEYNVTALPAGKYQYTIKSEVALYVDANGLVLFADGIEDEGSYIYIDEFSVHTSSSKSPIVAHAYFLDGTEEDITVNKVGNDKVSGFDWMVTLNADTGWYKFSKKDSGKYDLTKATDVTIADTADTVVTDYKAQKADLADGTYFGNKTTKFIVVDKKDNVKVYEGIKNMPKTVLGANGIADAVLTTDTNYAKYVFIDVDNGDVKGGSVSKDQLYILKLDATYGHDNDADKYYRYKAILNGEETKVKVEASVDIAIGTLYTNVEYNTKGYVSSADVVEQGDDYAVETSVAGATFTYKSNTVVMTLADKTKVNFYMADDAKIYLINDKDDVSVVSGDTLVREVGKIVDKNGDPCGLLANSTVYAVKNNDTECTALYVYNLK